MNSELIPTILDRPNIPGQDINLTSYPFVMSNSQWYIKCMKITFITGNAGKAEEVSRYLGLEIDHHSLDLEEIQSLDLEEIVKDKALRAYSKIGKPVLVEDVSFVFHALGKLPGPLIKWFLKELENEGLCRLIDGKDRRCTAKVCYGFCDGETVHLFDGSMSGTISDSP